MIDIVTFKLPGFPGETFKARKQQMRAQSGGRLQIQTCHGDGSWEGSVDSSVAGYSRAADKFTWMGAGA